MKNARPKQKDIKFFSVFWREWKEGRRRGPFDSKEHIGVAHYRLWLILVSERRKWRRLLRRQFGYDVGANRFVGVLGKATANVASALEPDPAEMNSSQAPFNYLSRQRRVKRHPFFIALKEYLVVLQCLQTRCSAPPDLINNLYYSCDVLLNQSCDFNGVRYSSQDLIESINQPEFSKGETYGEYMKRPEAQHIYACEQACDDFHATYWPLFKVLDSDWLTDEGMELFFGGHAYQGISLQVARSLRGQLRQVFPNAYDGLRSLLPETTKAVLQEIWKESDPIKRLEAFDKLPGKTSNLLRKQLPALEKKDQTNCVPFNEDTVPASQQEIQTRLVTTEMIETQIAVKGLTDREREVYLLKKTQGYTLAEIASILNIKPGTVASHYDRAKVKLGLTPKRQTKNNNNFPLM